MGLEETSAPSVDSQIDEQAVQEALDALTPLERMAYIHDVLDGEIQWGNLQGKAIEEANKLFHKLDRDLAECRYVEWERAMELAPDGQQQLEQHYGHVADVINQALVIFHRYELSLNGGKLPEDLLRMPEDGRLMHFLQLFWEDGDRTNGVTFMNHRVGAELRALTTLSSASRMNFVQHVIRETMRVRRDNTETGQPIDDTFSISAQDVRRSRMRFRGDVLSAYPSLQNLPEMREMIEERTRDTLSNGDGLLDRLNTAPKPPAFDGDNFRADLRMQNYVDIQLPRADVHVLQNVPRAMELQNAQGEGLVGRLTGSFKVPSIHPNLLKKGAETQSGGASGVIVDLDATGPDSSPGSAPEPEPEPEPEEELNPREVLQAMTAPQRLSLLFNYYTKKMTEKKATRTEMRLARKVARVLQEYQYVLYENAMRENGNEDALKPHYQDVARIFTEALELFHEFELAYGGMLPAGEPKFPTATSGRSQLFRDVMEMSNPKDTADNDIGYTLREHPAAIRYRRLVVTEQTFPDLVLNQEEKAKRSAGGEAINDLTVSPTQVAKQRVSVSGSVDRDIRKLTNLDGAHSIDMRKAVIATFGSVKRATLNFDDLTPKPKLPTLPVLEDGDFDTEIAKRFPINAYKGKKVELRVPDLDDKLKAATDAARAGTSPEAALTDQSGRSIDKPKKRTRQASQRMPFWQRWKNAAGYVDKTKVNGAPQVGILGTTRRKVAAVLLGVGVAAAGVYAAYQYFNDDNKAPITTAHKAPDTPDAGLPEQVPDAPVNMDFVVDADFPEEEPAESPAPERIVVNDVQPPVVDKVPEEKPAEPVPVTLEEAPIESEIDHSMERDTVQSGDSGTTIAWRIKNSNIREHRAAARTEADPRKQNLHRQIIEAWKDVSPRAFGGQISDLNNMGGEHGRFLAGETIDIPIPQDIQDLKAQLDKRLEPQITRSQGTETVKFTTVRKVPHKHTATKSSSGPMSTPDASPGEVPQISLDGNPDSVTSGTAAEVATTISPAVMKVGRHIVDTKFDKIKAGTSPVQAAFQYSTRQMMRFRRLAREDATNSAVYKQLADFYKGIKSREFAKAIREVNHAGHVPGAKGDMPPMYEGHDVMIPIPDGAIAIIRQLKNPADEQMAATLAGLR